MKPLGLGAYMGAHNKPMGEPSRGLGRPIRPGSPVSAAMPSAAVPSAAVPGNTGIVPPAKPAYTPPKPTPGATMPTTASLLANSTPNMDAASSGNMVDRYDATGNKVGQQFRPSNLVNEAEWRAANTNLSPTTVPIFRNGHRVAGQVTASPGVAPVVDLNMRAATEAERQALTSQPAVQANPSLASQVQTPDPVAVAAIQAALKAQQATVPAKVDPRDRAALARQEMADLNARYRQTLAQPQATPTATQILKGDY